MARSTYVYVVLHRAFLPEATFTVKHEMKTWLKRHPQYKPEDTDVYRYYDNPEDGQEISKMASEDVFDL